MALDLRGIVTLIQSSFLLFLVLWTARQILRGYRKIQVQIEWVAEKSQIDLANATSTEERFVVLEEMRETIALLRHEALLGHVWGALSILMGFVAFGTAGPSKFALAAGLAAIVAGWLLVLLIAVISGKRIDGLSRLILSSFAEMRKEIRKNAASE